ncbi:hypothetical protein HW555_002448 [Spodoptera exigua]|uniref:Uncharacterized protein n=1 Tax=Spodoptera exigua TaxID=7107 RepID=A0A835LEE2_SPOEX|nr:hypothetical protein HW555_002448 [Spodoptera exigua]
MMSRHHEYRVVDVNASLSVSQTDDERVVAHLVSTLTKAPTEKAIFMQRTNTSYLEAVTLLVTQSIRHPFSKLLAASRYSRIRHLRYCIVKRDVSSIPTCSVTVSLSLMYHNLTLVNVRRSSVCHISSPFHQALALRGRRDQRPSCLVVRRGSTTPALPGTRPRRHIIDYIL